MNSILIVDDEKDNLEALRRLLRTEFKVDITTSPFDALKMIQKEEYAVIISDQRMPEMTGVELLEKSRTVAPLTTRILLTGYTDIDSVIGAINRGNIYRYVAKPWDPEDLRLTLRQAAESFRLRKEIETKNRDLSQALGELKVLDKAKANFVSLLSHELNTPLTVLTSYGTLLSEKMKALPPDLQKAVGAIQKATDRLSEIVSEILTYVKLDLENTMKPVPFDVAGEVKGIFKTQKASVSKRNLTVTNALAEHATRCDSGKMKLALNKLIEETIKRAPEKSEIKLGSEQKNGTVHYWIWRGGEPLAESAFAPFVSSGNQMHHQKDMGLGLATFKLIVEGHAGSVELESSDKKGTKISFSLPADGTHSQSSGKTGSP